MRFCLFLFITNKLRMKIFKLKFEEIKLQDIEELVGMYIETFNTFRDEKTVEFYNKRGYMVDNNAVVMKR